MSTVAHELAHGFGLGDEYGGGKSGPLLPTESYLNLQQRSELTAVGGTPAIDANLTKWLWPRITAAGVLAAAPTRVGPDLRVRLQPGHGVFFREGDVVRMRPRPLQQTTGQTGRFRVVGPRVGDELALRIADGAIYTDSACSRCRRALCSSCRVGPGRPARSVSTMTSGS